LPIIICIYLRIERERESWIWLKVKLATIRILHLASKISRAHQIFLGDSKQISCVWPCFLLHGGRNLRNKSKGHDFFKKIWIMKREDL
jgi:hypothetical protein